MPWLSVHKILEKNGSKPEEVSSDQSKALNTGSRIYSPRPTEERPWSLLPEAGMGLETLQTPLQFRLPKQRTSRAAGAVVQSRPAEQVVNYIRQVIGDGKRLRIVNRRANTFPRSSLSIHQNRTFVHTH